MTKRKERTPKTLTPAFRNSQKSVGFDPSLYIHFLKDSSLSEAQKTELLHDLWKILSGFVQLGFGIHPIQQAMDDKAECGQVIPKASELRTVLIDCEHNKTIGGQHAG